jgi:hypothetical protein
VGWGQDRVSQTYDYKKPRKLNWVSLLVLAVLGGGVYFGWYYAPVYYQRYKVDRVLGDMGYRSIDLPSLTGDAAVQLESDLLDQARRQIRDLGIATEDETALDVYFDADYSHIVAEYSVTVSPIVGEPKTLTFRRQADIPQANTGSAFD